MICPFRCDIEYEFMKTSGGLRLKAQREVFPTCETFNCPFWDVTTCSRVQALKEEYEEE